MAWPVFAKCSKVKKQIEDLFDLSPPPQSQEVGNDVDNLLEARELVDDDLETLALVLAIAVVRIHLALRPMCGALTAT